MYANPSPLMIRANDDDVQCAAYAFDDDDGGCDCGDGDERRSAIRDPQHCCVDCAMVSIVVCLHINAVARLVSRGSCPMAVMICQPNMRANPHGECSADACCVPNQQFHVCDADSQYSLLIHLYAEFHHMILNQKATQTKNPTQAFFL